MGRGELQGGAARPHAAGASRHGGNRPHRRQALLCQGGERQPRHGIAVLDAASRECHGQLGQGRATRARPFAARPCRCGPAVAKRLERQRHRRYPVRGRCFFRRAEAFVGGGDARIDSMSAPIEGRRRALITVFLMSASIMQVLDNTIANVALPRVQGALSATQDQMAWVLTSYIVAAAIMTPMAGWLAGRFGRKQIVLISIAGFTLASMLCGIAQSLPQMVLARLLQGACGAALVPMSQAVMLDIYPGEQLAKAMSIWVTGITIGPIMGPALGGWLTDNYNWRWVFYINVPIGIVAFFGTLTTLPKSTAKKAPFDFFGFATLSLAVGALQITLDRGQLKDWFNSPEICIEPAVSGASLYLFMVHMITARKTRFLDPSLFKDRNFVAGCLFIFNVGLLLYATLALLPPLLQDLMNYPVVTTGLVTAPRGLGTLIAMVIIARFS